MTTEVEKTASKPVYELACTDCSFESTVEGEFLDALDVADEHQEQYAGSSMEHFVNVEQHGHRNQGAADE